jgi:hypothetical protein
MPSASASISSSEANLRQTLFYVQRAAAEWRLNWAYLSALSGAINGAGEKTSRKILKEVLGKDANRIIQAWRKRAPADDLSTQYQATKRAVARRRLNYAYISELVDGATAAGKETALKAMGAGYVAQIREWADALQRKGHKMSPDLKKKLDALDAPVRRKLTRRRSADSVSHPSAV